LESYSINVVEQLTGIKAHTLRIWEKRYRSLIPHRTATNIRYYDGGQLKRLLNVHTLLDRGYKISKLMNLSDDEIHKTIASDDTAGTEGTAHIGHINDLISAMLSFDEFQFDKVLSMAALRLGTGDTVLKIVYPFLRRVGVLWITNGATPAHEHFVSNIIKRKLLAAVDSIPLPLNATKKILLFLPPNEWHELGLVFCDFIIRNAGIETIYLGQNVPYNCLDETLSAIDPDIIITFFLTALHSEEHMRYLTATANSRPGMKVLVCTNLLHAVDDMPTNIALLNDPGQLLTYL
jgi:DNA-binding transcriptional MerR regulator